MKKLRLILLNALLTAAPFATAGDTPLVDDTAKLNYSVGYQIGSDFKYQEIEIRPEAVIQGIRDALSDSEAKLSPAEMNNLMAELGKELAERKRKVRAKLLEERLQESRQFHEKNKQKSGVVTTESGLQYRVIESGRGEHPKANDKVLVHYRGKLLDGTEFDSSYRHGKPASLQVDKLIKGWSEALQLMKRGDRWQIYLPPDIAYGETGSPPAIPPNSSLIFDVYLLAIE